MTRSSEKPVWRPYAGMLSLIAVLTGTLLTTGCDRYPKDPQNSLEQVLERGALRVGVSEAEPWVVRQVGGEPGGVEAELIRGFADSLGVEVEWNWGPSQAHFEALSGYEIDVVIGGHINKNPWTRHVGATLVYYTSETRIGTPPGAPPLVDLKGVEVGVRPVSGLKNKIEEKGGHPVEIASLEEALIPVAGERFELEELGYTVTDIELGSARRHLMAVPPGENALLMALEKHLLHAMSEEQIVQTLRAVHQ